MPAIAVWINCLKVSQLDTANPGFEGYDAKKIYGRAGSRGYIGLEVHPNVHIAATACVRTVAELVHGQVRRPPYDPPNRPPTIMIAHELAWDDQGSVRRWANRQPVIRGSFGYT